MTATPFRDTRAPAPPSGTAPPASAGEAETLARTWGTPRGLWGWLTTVDHKAIARRYIITAFGFFLLGGLDAALMRIQLARPENGFLTPDQYNQLFSTHGTTMMFLFAVPIMQAAGLYLVPLMVGTRNVAFPRLNAFGYYSYLIGGLLLYTGLLLNSGVDTGWFSYVPLAGPVFSPGKRVDVWAQAVTFTEIAALVAAVEIIVTAFKQRAPGMSLNRVPLFVWASVVTSFMVIFAMPSVATASLFLAMDRSIGTLFFDSSQGGDPILWQHMFWFFGHPEVYIIFLPALGFISSMVATFARREIFGYPAVVLSMVATGFVSFALWVHHMFAGPIPQMGESLFTVSSMLIALPTGVQLFCWIATLWLGRPHLRVPLLWVLGFFPLILIGGATGVMIASVPLDLQVHDTFFIVAHLHYVLVGGAVFPLFGAFYYWFPKATGRMLSERAGRWNFWLFFAGINLTFFPMHQLGLQGMPRRVYTYLAEMGWGELNLLATIGAGVIALSVLVFLGNVVTSLRRGALAGDDPWGGETLEWATSSPPPPYNFAHIPVVEGRAALWDRSAQTPVVTGLATECREVLITSPLDAEPDHRYEQPGPTIWPLGMAVAVGVTFIGSIFTPWAVPVGLALALIPFAGWGWPREQHPRPASAAEVAS